MKKNKKQDTKIMFNLRAASVRKDKLGYSNNHRKCNICHKNFKMRSKFDRFCLICKEESELYQQGDFYDNFHEDAIASLGLADKLA